MGSDRRYEWAKLKSGLVFGHKYGKCPWYTQGLMSSLSVDTCMCICESDDRNAARYISLREETSDLHQNK